MLYLGVTAMTEVPFMLFFIISAYCFQKYTLGRPVKSLEASLDLERNPSGWVYSYRLYHLIKCSLFISLATLCRYEGWILPIFFVPYVIITRIIRTDNLTSTININRRTKIRLSNITLLKAIPILVSLLSFSGIAFMDGI